MDGWSFIPPNFVYHAENKMSPKFQEYEIWKKFYLYIMTNMILSWYLAYLIHSIGFQQLGQAWMLIKIVLVTFLTIYHFYLGNILNKFKIEQNTHSHKFYRFINEIPTILLILIVFVVIFKPL